jgi:stage V sporulation protein AC
MLYRSRLRRTKAVAALRQGRKEDQNMKPTPKEYSKMTGKASPPSSFVKDMILAFVCGGAICTVGQLLCNLYQNAGMSQNAARATVSVSLIGIVAILTAFNVYDDFAKFAGAGSLVPITGFANAMVSPAIEFKTEGHVLGIGAKMFSIAGPVILYGTFASAVYGLIIWIFRLF